MLKAILTATAISIAAVPAHANQWWMTTAGTASGCVVATDDLTPAAFYKLMKQSSSMQNLPAPEIIDDGGPRVEMKYYDRGPKRIEFFRTEAACIALVQEIKAAKQAEDKMLEKYK